MLLWKNSAEGRKKAAFKVKLHTYYRQCFALKQVNISTPELRAGDDNNLQLQNDIITRKVWSFICIFGVKVSFELKRFS